MTYRRALWLSLAVTALLGHVCGVEGPHTHALQAVSSTTSADTHSEEAGGIHDASCEGLQPTPVSLDVGYLGGHLHAVSDNTVTVPTRGVWVLSPPAWRRPALFVLHSALLI
jgi:hypothetical protein